MNATTLIIARHGNTFSAGEAVRRVGITNLPLVQSGIEQGEKLAQYLLERGIKPIAIFTSQLQRTKQMADIFCAVMKAASMKQLAGDLVGASVGKDIPINAPKITAPSITSLNMFNEINYGIDENQPETQVIARLGGALKLWDEKAIPPPEWNVNIEEIIHNWRDFANATIAQRHNETTLIFTSNGIARFAPSLVGAISQFNHNLKLSTGAFAILSHDDESWSIKDWNITP